MKKILPILILLAAVFYLTPLYPVYAIDSSKSAYPVNTLRINNKLELREASREGRIGDLRDRIASRTALLKQKLASFRDQIKAQRVQRINDALALINKTRTEVMLKHYNVMNEILNNVENRVNDAANNGKNMDAAKSSISKARTALNDVKKAIDAQAAKDYTINVTDETTVKADAMAAKQQLYQDLKAIRDQLMSARETIVEAIKQALTSIGGSTNGQQ